MRNTNTPMVNTLSLFVTGSLHNETVNFFKLVTIVLENFFILYLYFICVLFI